jgi:DivIVA domain-containing protein
MTTARTSEELAQEIRSARFTPVRLREGYDMGEVDQFLDELELLVREGRAASHVVSAKRFTPVRLREGYDMGDVDDFIDRVGREADVLAAQGRPSEPVATTTEVPVPAPTSTPPAATADPGVISEQRGVFARLFGKR